MRMFFPAGILLVVGLVILWPHDYTKKQIMGDELALAVMEMPMHLPIRTDSLQMAMRNILGDTLALGQGRRATIEVDGMFMEIQLDSTLTHWRRTR